jgi:hypothetical protein
MNSDANCACPGSAEILADLAATDLLQLQPDERLWKLYCFRTPGHATGLRHRIYTKLKASGRLALVTFAAHDPQPWSNHDDHASADAEPAPLAGPVRSGIARVPDLSVNDLDRVVAAMRQSNAVVYEEIDLSAFDTLVDQLAWLEESS